MRDDHPTVRDYVAGKGSPDQEVTCVQYIGMVSAALIQFAEKQPRHETKTAAAWKKEFGSYLKSRTPVKR